MFQAEEDYESGLGKKKIRSLVIIKGGKGGGGRGEGEGRGRGRGGKKENTVISYHQGGEGGRE